MRRLAPLLFLAACVRDKPPEGGEEGGEGGEEGGGAECTSDAECGADQICEDESCVWGDRNNAVEEAEALLWESSATGVINPAGDVDYYSFSAEGGEFLRAHVILDAGEPSDDGPNTALSLRDAAGKVVFAVDNFPTGGSVSTYDAVVLAWLAEAGTYTLQVEDVGTWDGSREPQGDPDYGYTLELKEYPAHTDEEDSALVSGYSLDLESDGSIYSVGVALESEGDIDYIDVDFPWNEAGIYFQGPYDPGSSEATPLLRLYDEGGQLLTEKVGLGTEGVALYPAMKQGDYLLTLEDASGGGGGDHWTFIFVTLDGAGDGFPAEEEPNDDSATASSFETTETYYEDDEGEQYPYAYALVQGALDPLGDADWVAVDTYQDGYLTICLFSTDYGSAVTPTIDVYNTDGVLERTYEGDASESSPTTLVENHPTDGGLYWFSVYDPLAATAGPQAWYELIYFSQSIELYFGVCD